MVVLQPQDYERLAKEAVAAFESGTPLNDHIFKVASDMGLNPHQIRRVVEMSNTAAHLSILEKQAAAGAEDRYVQFTLADPDYVLKRMYTPAIDQPMDVPTADKLADFHTPIEIVEKVAEDSFLTDPVPVEVSQKTAADRQGKKIILLRKVAEELGSHMAQAQQGYHEAIETLAWDLRKLGTDHDEFEKDAYALAGDVILPILGDIRVSMNLKEGVSQEKIASPVERVVDTGHAHMQKLIKCAAYFADAVRFKRSLDLLKEKAGQYL